MRIITVQCSFVIVDINNDAEHRAEKVIDILSNIVGVNDVSMEILRDKN